jgi:predicted ATPase/transcriptional regulator with XRE-family HTH domain
MMVEMTRFGALLKRYRRAAGLSQEALAERAGLSTRAISDLERGVNHSPRYATLELLVKALSLSSQQSDLLKAAAYPDLSSSPVVDLHPAQTGIPQPPTRLIGRAAERSQAAGLLRSGGVRLLTLTGPSGVGKTRLALELAQDLAPEFADGVVYLPLASERDARRVPNMVAQVLRLHELPAVAVQDQVIQALRPRHLLLVLDNLEQLLDCSPFIAKLLENCPQLVILATSRSALRLRAEQEFLLAPLPIDDAVQLFSERAHSVRPGLMFPMDQVASICQQLDCLPLAIELAAMHGRLFSIDELRKRVTQRFELLRGGARDLPARQQTMEDAIAWSYELLPPAQQRCFRALGVFVGGWTLEAAEAICWPQGELELGERLLTLTGLVEASLVQTEVAGSIVRFSMLRLIREYALQQLHAAGETEQVRSAHANYYAGLAEKAKSVFESGPVDANLPLARELPNVQAALEWVDELHNPELGLQLCGFARLWHVLGQSSLAEGWFERMLALDLEQREAGNSAVPLEQRIEKLYGFGRVLLSRGQSERAETTTREALTLAQDTGDEKGMTHAWANLGLIAQAGGALDEAERAFKQSALHATRAKDDPLQYRAYVFMAEIARQRGELSQAAELLDTALASAQASDAVWDIAIITTLLGHLARQKQDFPSAKRRYVESLRRLSAFGSPTYIAWCLEGCAAVLCEEMRFIPGVRMLAVAANLRRQAGTPPPENERAVLDQVMEKAREYLGQEAFLREWSFGQALNQDEALQMAFSEME